MGVFSRFKDIIASNINAMLEKAEDPEKLIKLMIQEMEDTLVEIKANCAGTMATRTRVERSLGMVRAEVTDWDRKAKLALTKGREDMAREALVEKKRYQEETARLQSEDDRLQVLVQQYQSEIEQLEQKLDSARKKYHSLLHRQTYAQSKKQAQTRIRKAETTDAFARFESVENRVDRLEAEADLVNPKRRPSLDKEFAQLESCDEIDGEIQMMKEQLAASLSGPAAN